jgi:RNA polymerase sigma factor for flagellar operon FliA
MRDTLDPGTLFLQSLELIEGIAASICRRYSVWGDDADEFVSWAKERLVENDYAVLSKYRGESELNTYLTVVVTRLFHAHARELKGRWRPSAKAVRLGQAAVDLEALVHRDGCSLQEAGERLRSARRTDLSDAQLARLLAQLREREPLRPVEVGADPLEHAPGTARADDRVRAAEAERHHDRLASALAAVMEGLDPEDAAILRMHFAEGRKVADVSRALNLEQRPLYRRIERLCERLKEEMERRGVSREDVLEMLEDPQAETD